MKGVIYCSLTAALLVAPAMAWADANPDFDDDAKPILRAQPGLLQYVESRFEVKDTGTAKYPGDDDHRPGPPYIFRARPLGSHGPFNLRLLIQPGPPGHVLGVVDITKAHINEPGAAQPPQVAQQPAPAPTYQSPSLSQGEVKPLPPATEPAQNPASTPAPAQSPEPPAPTSDTPSGPIMGPAPAGSASSQPSLAPPPDPAPSNQ
jgi:hypothetical protein